MPFGPIREKRNGGAAPPASAAEADAILGPAPFWEPSRPPTLLGEQPLPDYVVALRTVRDHGPTLPFRGTAMFYRTGSARLAFGEREVRKFRL